jgi:hypothetical protein
MIHTDENVDRSDRSTPIQEKSITSPISEEPKSFSKNAYEIRADIVGMALDWVKFKKQAANCPGACFNVTDDEVLDTASKFYRFVENRR